MRIFIFFCSKVETFSTRMHALRLSLLLHQIGQDSVRFFASPCIFAQDFIRRSQNFESDNTQWRKKKKLNYKPLWWAIRCMNNNMSDMYDGWIWVLKTLCTPWWNAFYILVVTKIYRHLCVYRPILIFPPYPFDGFGGTSWIKHQIWVNISSHLKKYVLSLLVWPCDLRCIYEIRGIKVRFNGSWV